MYGLYLESIGTVCSQISFLSDSQDRIFFIIICGHVLPSFFSSL